MKTLYIHIGTPKTATTSIQNILWNNEEALKRRGYIYPHMPYVYSSKIMQRNALFLVEPLFDENGDRDKKAEVRRFKDGMAMIHEYFQTYDNVVLSNEGIWAAVIGKKPSLWKWLLKDSIKFGYEIKIIVYLRRQIEYIASQWNQKVKNNIKKLASKQTWDDFSQELSPYWGLDYYENLSKITEVLGKEAVIVRRFDRKEFKNGDIIQDFAELIGISDISDFNIETDVYNTGLLGNTHEIKRIFNANRQSTPEEEHWVRRTLLRLSEASGKRYSAKAYSPEEAKNMMDEYAEGNQKIAEEYLADGKPLFEDGNKDYIKWMPDNAYMHEDMMAFTLELIMDLKSEIGQLKERCKHLEEIERQQAKEIVRLSKMEHQIGVRRVCANTVKSITKKR